MRLIDADELRKKLKLLTDRNNPNWNYDVHVAAAIFVDILDNQPTIEMADY